MLIYFRTIISDCLDEFSRNGLKGLFRRSRTYLADPRRQAIRHELKSWPKHKRLPEQVRAELPQKGQSGMVSVVIPIYDRTWELQESIESILAQTYREFELLLVTDGSPQETREVVEKYRDNSQVRIFHFPDSSGTAVRGRNVGIAEARGEFVAFQDSDDNSEPYRLADSVALIREQDADIVYGGWRVHIESERADVEYKNGKVLFPPRELFSLILVLRRLLFFYEN